MVRKIAAFLGTFAMLSSGADAARWAIVNTTATGVQFVDLDSVVFDKAIATIWLRTELAEEGKRGASVTLEKWMHDCANRRVKLIALTLYKADGSVIGSAELPRYQEEWSEIVPYSAPEIVHRRICG